MHPFETNFTKAQAANENLAESSRGRANREIR